MIGYEITGELFRTGRHVVSRGRRPTDGLPVLLKFAAAGHSNLRREYELLRQLACDGLARACEFVHAADGDWLVVEDRGYLPLSMRLSDRQPTLEVFFSFALELCAIVTELHRRDVIHGGLNPQAILVGDGLAGVELFDLTLAQQPPVDAQAMAAAILAAGGAAYMAPEQTGRINRTIDHRADLYAIGATFYEVLTGRPPFGAEDPLELVHSHIARTPLPPAIVTSGVPDQVSRIVMRLLAKAGEDRYQSALGLRHDLERCRREWSETESISDFELGARDISQQLLIPQRLYGRESDLAVLTRAFEDALHSGPALLLVAGEPGVGKTAFINELCGPVVRQRGYFVTGKFDQVARNVPYGALLQALRSLMWQVLADKEERLVQWRTELSRALGANGGVVAGVLPEIEFVIGKQQPAVALDAVEAQNRFRFVFQAFVGSFAKADHPLVIFLDDLQWVDSATIDLLTSLLTASEQRPLLFIGTYRNTEVAPDHPLAVAIRELERLNARVHHLTLQSLAMPSLVTFLADTFRVDAVEVERLGALIRQKTGGNPFFVIQFLQTLRRDELLSLDDARGCWTFHLEAIAAAATTDNVVAFMTERIRRLSPRAQEVLRLAACIGNAFRWQTFLTASGLNQDEAAAGLAEAMRNGLIRPAEHDSEREASSALPGAAYAFVHDRVQQAAYALIADDQRPAVHLDVGRQLLAECRGSVPEDRLFEIVNHFNIGSQLTRDADERLQLVRLNLAASRKAKAAAAFRAALDYLEAGIALCAEAHWTTYYALTFELHLERAECLYLSGRFDEAERAQGQLLMRAASNIDEARVHELRVTYYENRSRYPEAIASGRDGLAVFGLALPEADASVDHALEGELAAIQRLLGGRAIGSLVNLPVMADGEMRMAMRILTLMWAPVYISGNQRLTSLISAMMVRLSLAYGNTEDSAYGYVTHAITVGPVRRDFRAAYEWGELAVALNERFGDTKRRAKVHQQIHAHVKLWRQPFDACIPHAREAMRSGLEAGDFAYAGYGAATQSWPALLASRDLAAFVHDQTPALEFLDKINMSGLRDALRVMLNWALALQGRTISPLSLTNGQLDEATFIARYKTTAPLFMTILRCAKLHLCVVFDETASGLDAVAQARAVTIPGTMWPVLEDLWGSLALAAAHRGASGEERQRFRARIASAGQSLRELADNCPENFRCFSLLVDAELARLDGDLAAAAGLYKEGIAYASLTGNIQQEALASDFCARALIASGDDRAAADFLRRAYDSYAAWGALAKLRQLEERYGRLLPARTVPVPDLATHRPHVDPGTPLVSFDVRSVLAVAQAIAGEIELDALVRKLMTIALENAGAERGVFLRVEEDDVVPVVEAIARNDRIDVRRDVGWSEAGPLAHAVVRSVRRTRQDVVIGTASSDERFAVQARKQRGGGVPADRSALVAAESILCVPVAHQGRLSGILYLENRLSEAFTPARTEIIRVLATQTAISFENARLYEEMKQEAARRRRAEELLRALTEGTASATGSDFFKPLVRHLASALEVRYAFVTECRDKTRRRATSLAFWKGDDFGDNFEYDLAGTPCMKVVDGRVCHYSDNVRELFPDDRELIALGAESYLGAPMFNASGQVIGHLAVLNDTVMPEDRWRTAVLRIFAARAGAELERLRAEEDLRQALHEVESLKNRLQAENVYLQEEIRREHNFDEIVGSSPALLDVLRKVERVAPTEATVLINGETGCGKELIARAIHSHSGRKIRPLVKVNCGAIAPGLVESELFGHVKGAFTGAVDKRVGRFELANGGTIFLDEVGELPLEAQVKLLRVLQEQEFEPVGSSRTIRVDVRVIAATNRDLAQAVREGKFRADLLYRLNVFPIQVPPLRDRQSDIPLLVGFVLTKIARRIGKPVQGVTARSMERLLRYEWPGNIRELWNVVERATILADGPFLEIAAADVGGSPHDEQVAAVASPAGTSLDEIQRAHILSVLRSTGGVVEGVRGAATILGMHPNTLRSRMKKLGINPARL